MNEKPTGRILFKNGDIIYGKGFGSEGLCSGELCFNTGMTGYQEIITDPSYSEQIINFTFPHIGIVGTNKFDNESLPIKAKGIILRHLPTKPSNWRSEESLIDWLKKNKKFGICNVDTRKLTRMIRNFGMTNIAMEYNEKGIFNDEKLNNTLKLFPGLDRRDLAKDASCSKTYLWEEGKYDLYKGYKKFNSIKNRKKILAFDFGAKSNIFRCLSDDNFHLEILPADCNFDELTKKKPDGLFLSNGPGDPLATSEYMVPILKELIEKTNIPIFGICLGHQILATALGAKTKKMKFGHHGVNHPVKEIKSGKVEITSMNHGFTVDKETLPDYVQETHISLFDKSNCGIKYKGRPIFSVQFHPEASPGPIDSMYLFEKFKLYILDGN